MNREFLINNRILKGSLITGLIYFLAKTTINQSRLFANKIRINKFANNVVSIYLFEIYLFKLPLNLKTSYLIVFAYNLVIIILFISIMSCKAFFFFLLGSKIFIYSSL